MELAFRDDVRKANGDIKFPAGVFFEWPKSTFQQVAASLGKPLEEITVTKEETGKIFSAKVVGKKLVVDPEEKPKASQKRQRVRLKLKE